MWLPRGSLIARIQSWGFMSVVAKAGLLSTPPYRVPIPEALNGSAIATYAMDEPVLSTRSVLETLAAPHRRFIAKADADLQPDGSVPSMNLRPRAVVLAAGEGNAELLKKIGLQPDLMQRRPLNMFLLRGDLPDLFGHCVAGGKTRLTVTTPDSGIWQIGGEIAERESTFDEIRRWLPGVDFSGVEFATYRANRAEARTSDLRRPSGVHVSVVKPNIAVAWPTKLALAPVLADEVFSALDLKEPGRYDGELPEWPAPSVAPYPWQEASWSRVQ